MDNETTMKRFAERTSDMKLQLFTRLLRKNLVEAGVDEDTFDNIAQATNLELQIQQSQQNLIDQALHSFDNRGMDTVGRLIVEYCFVRSTSGKRIWPEYSDEDSAARWNYTETVVPRPLMRYFLISVRGPIKEIDGFESSSFLFNEHPQSIESLRQHIASLIESFKGPFGSGESAVDWQSVYENREFQELALNLISQMRQKLEESGFDSYLSQLEEYRQIDPNSNERNLMQRPFTVQDATQIHEALASAEHSLKELTH